MVGQDEDEHVPVMVDWKLWPQTLQLKYPILSFRLSLTETDLS
jgi:hypothetical protein